MHAKEVIDTTDGKQQDLILATTSVYRLEIFNKLGLHFSSEGSNVDEYTADRPSDPKDLTRYLAMLKAEAVAKNHTSGVIVGFDTVGLFEGEILEKPKTRDEAFVRLQKLSGQKFEYYTGIYATNLDIQKVLSNITKTEIYMRKYSDDEINYYLDHCDEKYKTHAHGFNPENYYSMSFIQKIVGDPNGVVGIPLGEIMKVLKDIGYKI